MYAYAHSLAFLHISHVPLFSSKSASLAGKWLPRIKSGSYDLFESQEVGMYLVKSCIAKQSPAPDYARASLSLVSVMGILISLPQYRLAGTSAAAQGNLAGGLARFEPRADGPWCDRIDQKSEPCARMPSTVGRWEPFTHTGRIRRVPFFC